MPPLWRDSYFWRGVDYFHVLWCGTTHRVCHCNFDIKGEVVLSQILIKILRSVFNLNIAFSSHALYRGVWTKVLTGDKDAECFGSGSGFW